MAFKFRCKNCGEDIAVRFLKVGEIAECKNCGASNSVPDSAGEISDEAAESMIKASVSESAKSISDGPAKSVPIAKVLRIIGIISIGFGVIVGIAMLILFGQPIGSSDAPGGLVLGGMLTALGIGMSVFYCTLGVLCLGIAKVIGLLSK